MVWCKNDVVRHVLAVSSFISTWITSVNELSHLLEIFFHQTSGGQSRRAKPEAAWPQSTLIPYTNTGERKHLGRATSRCTVNSSL